MSTDFSVRPVGAPVATLVVHNSGQTANNAVATELPARQSVTATAASTGARNDPQSVSDSVSHQAFIDQAAAAIVFQAVNTKTGQVVEQFPDEVVLRRRAYFRALDLTKEESTHQLATDREA